jgi:hypothetical protein
MSKKYRQKRNTLPRKSSLKGRLARLALRQKHVPRDMPERGLHYIMPGSMKK